MRRGKKEEIRRLLVATASMCDRGSLEEVRRHLLAAVNSLDQVEEKESKKRIINTHEQKIKSPNPKLTIERIDQMIERELDKNSRPLDGSQTQ